MSSFLISGAAARNNMVTMGVTMVAEIVTLVTGVLLLVYNAVEGMQNR
jgi:hypothetical protein